MIELWSVVIGMLVLIVILIWRVRLSEIEIEICKRRLGLIESDHGLQEKINNLTKEVHKSRNDFNDIYSDIMEIKYKFPLVLKYLGIEYKCEPEVKHMVKIKGGYKK